MSISHDNDLLKEKNKRRIVYLILSRIIIITIFLLITVFISIKKQLFPLPDVTLKYFYFIVIVIYLFSAVYALLYKLGISYRRNIVLQITIDTLAVTFLIFMFGNTQIDYSLFYTLIIIYSAIFLGRKGGILVASISSIFYGIFINLEFHNLMPSLLPIIKIDSDIYTADALTNLMVRITSFYFLAFLASFISEQEKKASFLLEEKESEFNQLDRLFRSIVESVDTGIITIDLNNVIKTFNSGAEKITRLKRERVQGCKIDEVFPEFLPYLKKQMDDESLQSRIEITITDDQKGKINLGLSVSSLKGKTDKQIGNILIFQNITQIKQMERALEKSRNMALIGEMAAGWAHEVRNPLAAITGSIEILKQGMELEGTNKRLMEIILRGKNQLENFVRNFLVLARSVPVASEIIDLNKVIEESLEDIKLNKQWHKDNTVKKIFEQDINVYANKEQIRQVINNLLLNAIEAMNEGGGVLSVETKRETTHQKKKYTEIIITDTGCGINENDLNRIYEPFFTRKEKGTGLGLAIVNHIVEGYNGKIEIESAIGKGTTCRVLLPIEKA